MNANEDEPEVEPEDQPLSPEEEAEFQAKMRDLEAAFEAEATEAYGPPEVRARKNQRYAARLIRRFSEPVIRGLLLALSRLEEPTCAGDLSEMDLTSTPLAEIIQPFDICGRHFSISSADDSGYTVKISRGYARAGGGGEFLISRTGDGYTIKDSLREWTY